jgi:CHASE2 domain-containing sensor protein
MRSALFVLIMFVALTSIVSGLLMISDPPGTLLNLPLNILRQTPFKNFLIPGILLVCVGSVSLFAGFCNAQRYRSRYKWSIVAGLLISGWIIIQMLMINTIHWLHLLYLLTGTGILYLAMRLEKIRTH